MDSRKWWIKNRNPETNYMIPQKILDCWDFEGLMGGKN